MNTPNPNLVVKVDVTNPGQFFACCGLLELAHRLWPGAEGWFEAQSGKGQFFIRSSNQTTYDGMELFNALRICPIEGLSDAEKQERGELEARQRALKKSQQSLPRQDEERRTTLGKLAREGPLYIGSPFLLRLDWWQADDDEVVKTWAGKQENQPIAHAAQLALLNTPTMESIFDYACVWYAAADEKKAKKPKPVAPFYFDARQFAHRLDVGFSLDALGTVKTLAYPAVELLTLIGLQRFSPASAKEKWHFDYWTWSYPLPAPIAAAVVCGSALAGREQHYQFRLVFRDDQRRYKAFGFSNLIPTGE